MAALRTAVALSGGSATHYSNLGAKVARKGEGPTRDASVAAQPYLDGPTLSALGRSDLLDASEAHC